MAAVAALEMTEMSSARSTAAKQSWQQCTAARTVAPETSSAAPDSESGYPQQMTNLRALRQAMRKDDPQTRAQVDELIRAMQKLDPEPISRKSGDGGGAARAVPERYRHT